MKQRDIISAQEREAQKVAAQRKRIVIMGILLVGVVAARFAIKDPPPPKQADHSQTPFRAIPGLLNRLPESERNKLTPYQIAMLKEADAQATSKPSPTTMLAATPYKPEEAPREILAPETEKVSRFEYTKQKIVRSQYPTPEMVDLTKDTVVLFRAGGYVKVREATRVDGHVKIDIDPSMRAEVPKTIVRTILPKGLNWKQSPPPGMVELKPAKGITIVVSKHAAKRITIRGEDEI